jgi:2-C-methyl-D-erythritol 4-phosphate cytidylyltransferase
MKAGLIYLAGGTGKRIGGAIPKQFLPLEGKALALHAFSLFEKFDWIHETVVVVDPAYQRIFASSKEASYALPGKERMDSVYNGFKLLSEKIEMVIVHDGVRPFVKPHCVEELYHTALHHGAAALAVPLKFTVKHALEDKKVTFTPDRSTLFEIQTPQAVNRDLMEKGFSLAYANKRLVTDDVSLVELLGVPVHLVEGSHDNLKITTPDDWELAQILARKALCVSK